MHENDGAAPSSATETRAKSGRRDEGTAADASCTAAETLTRIESLVRDCERLSHYHSLRQRFFETIHNWTNFFILAAGSAAVAAIFSEYPDVGIYAAVVPPTLGGLDLVFQFSRRANEHSFLYRRICVLLGEMNSADWNRETLAAFQKSIHDIFADEPPVMWALNAYCHNAVCDSIGAPGDQYIPLRWHERMLMQLISFNGQGRRISTGA